MSSDGCGFPAISWMSLEMFSFTTSLTTSTADEYQYGQAVKPYHVIVCEIGEGERVI